MNTDIIDGKREDIVDQDNRLVTQKEFVKLKIAVVEIDSNNKIKQVVGRAKKDETIDGPTKISK